MPTVFPTSPHFDDFDESKEFVRILFRPGRAVQAREMTQLQTIIQAQIERFGKGIYKDGSFVSPPSETFDSFLSFVKLQDSFSGTDADDVVAGLVGQTIVGQTSGVRAVVINSAVSTAAGDPPSLFVKYTDGGTNKQETFTDNEQLQNEAGTTTVQAIASNATGFGTSFSIGTSTIFAKGNFLFVPQQTHIVEKYANVQNKIIGLSVTETVIDSDTDQTLLDPATGTFNFFAPGADRYKANLILASRDLEFIANTDPNFIEVVRVEEGQIISKNIDPRLSVLGDTLARRTFEESGNYIVEPFGLELREHLKPDPISQGFTNTYANIARVSNDGIFPKANGGDNALFVSVITPGQAYIKGYEVDDTPTRFLTVSKARDFANVVTGVIPSKTSSFVNITSANSIPDFATVESLSLRNKYKTSNAGQNGEIVGTAKARGIEYITGNIAFARGGAVGTDGRLATFKLHLFDIQMNPGKTFERDVKHLTGDLFEFAANIVPTVTNITGAVTFNNASTTVRGSGTKFGSELKVGDMLSVSNSTTTVRLEVATIVDDVTLTSTAPTTMNLQLGGFFTYATAGLNTANIGDSDKDILITKLPRDVVKAVDPDNINTTYTVKRQETRTLSSGAVTITAGSNETFSPFNAGNYQAIIVTGPRKGEFIEIASGDVTINGTSTEITFDFSGTPGENLTSEAVEFILTVNKRTSAALRKTKTLVENSTLTITENVKAQAAIIKLGKADGFRLKSVHMANIDTKFGMTYTTDRQANITSRYTFDTGQKATFYDLAKVKLKPGAAKPSRPIRITFDHFTHGSGDFFSVGSYPDYEDIPEVEFNGERFKLRDCLDFRPRINDAGTGFSGTGASTTEFFDQDVNFVSNFQFYLPKIDSIGLDENGNFFTVNGRSELNPREPNFPAELLKLFVLQQKPYVFDINSDIEVKRVENKRFTMKDIGKIENRVKTLEFYTTLNLLERDAQQEQIQDSLGFERFKNGFVVDSFTGHGVGDSLDNPDYAASVNFTKKEASPLIKSNFLNLREKSITTAQRTGNNYTVSGSVASLPFTDTILVRNPFSSKTQNLNPFNINMFQGLMKLSPPGDLWFDDRRVPQVEVDRTGTFDSLVSQSLIKRDGRNVFGSINDIEQFRNGIPQNTDELPENLRGLSDLLGSISPATSSVQLQGNEVVKNITVVPKMRDVSINVQVDGLRPNTRVYGFFDNQPVTAFMSLVTPEVKVLQNALAANISSGAAITDTRITRRNLANAMANTSIQLTTDNTGSIEVNFQYNSETMNLNTGKKLLRLSNSPINDIESEAAFAEQVFVSDGVIREISNEVLRPPPPPPPPPIPTVKDPQIDDDRSQPSILLQMYSDIRGSSPTVRDSEIAYWEEHFPGISTATNAADVPNVEACFASFSQGATTHGEQGKETQGGVADQFGDASAAGYYTQEEAQEELTDDLKNKYL